MGYLKRSAIWPDRRRKPPFGSVRLIRGHPRTLGLLTCSEIGVGITRDYVASRRVMSASGAALGVLGGGGVTGWQWTDASTPDLTLASGPHTIACRYVQLVDNIAGQYCDVFSKSAYVSEANNQGWTLQLRSGQYSYIVFNNNSGGNYPINAGTPTAGLHTIAGFSNGVSSRSLWVDGAVLGSRAENPVPASASAVCGNGTPNTTPLTYVLMTWIWNRALSLSELMDVHLDPYAGLEPVVRRRYSVPAAAGGPVVPVMNHHYRQMRAA